MRWVRRRRSSVSLGEMPEGRFEKREGGFEASLVDVDGSPRSFLSAARISR